MNYRGFIPIAAVLFLMLTGTMSVHSQAPAPKYVGSTVCADCHPSVYQRWTKTRMANVVTDPHVRPQVVIPDLSKADPLLTFTFAFIPPEMTDQYKVPNPCTACHTDRTTEWARNALKGWAGVSPWRVN